MSQSLSSGVICWPGSVPVTCTSRYLSTKAATPRACSHLATLTPSLSMSSRWKPPPGHTTTAVPVAVPGAGG
ncbi:MAG: hypothetical protein EOO62_34390 [Hymenobacter sp.]|nr:MAG: hypothetical protein EOO62_34390 [Hymenobacter sp.]